jgi:hypothetical protein
MCHSNVATCAVINFSLGSSSISFLYSGLPGFAAAISALISLICQNKMGQITISDRTSGMTSGMIYMSHLGFNQMSPRCYISQQEGQIQQQNLHWVACHVLSIVLIDIHIIEMCCIIVGYLDCARA